MEPAAILASPLDSVKGGRSDRTRGRTDVDMLRAHFGDPTRGICVGKATIDMMVFDTTNRTAHLSRGPEYGASWREYGFADRRG